MQDIRFALRSLLKSRWISGLIVACLALVIAGNTTVFAVFRSYILQPMPFPDSERLAMVFEINTKSSVGSGISMPSYLDYLDGAGGFETLAAISGGTFNLTDDDGPPEMISTQIVSPNFLSMMGAQPVGGRLLIEADSRPGADPVIVLTHDFWQQRFGGDPNVVGKKVQVDRVTTEVVGVLPDDFEYLDWTLDAWMPLTLDRNAEVDRSDRSIGHLLGHLRPGTTAEMAQQQLAVVLADLGQRFPEAYRDQDISARLLRDEVPGPTDTQLFTMIQGAGLFVLLIACANIGNLLLARGQARRRELAMRSALGAGKGRILRQLITESITLALVGGLVGIGLSVIGVQVLRQALTGGLPKMILPTMEPSVVLFSLGIAALAGIVFGLVPAFQALRGQLFTELREGGGRGSTGDQRRWAQVFVVGQVALTLALLIGAGVLLNTFLDVQYGPQGFDSDEVMTFALTLPEIDYPDDASRTLLQRQLLERAETLPGVVAATSTTAVPRGRNSPIAPVEIVGREVDDGVPPRTTWLSVDPGYLDTLGLRLLRGRNLERADREDAPLVALVDQNFAQRFFEGEDPLGQRLLIRGAEREIVGVTTSIRQRRIGVIDGPNSVVYLPYQQNPTANISWLLKTRTGTDATSLVAQLREQVGTLDRYLPVSSFQTLDAFIAQSLNGLDVFTVIVGAFSGFAVLLAALGLYGVLAYSVSRRRQEIGVRMAMGARRGSVLGLVLRQGLRLTLLGFVIGAPFAWGIRKLIMASLGALAQAPALLVPAIVGVLLLVALAACLLPARRASALAPTLALRAD